MIASWRVSQTKHWACQVPKSTFKEMERAAQRLTQNIGYVGEIRNGESVGKEHALFGSMCFLVWFTYIYHEFMSKVGKYTMHGSYGMGRIHCE